MTSMVKGQARSESSVLGWVGVSIVIAVVLALGCGGGEAPGEGEAAADAEAPASYPDAVTADPDHYTTEFENDTVRLVRIRYGPGETSVMHHHPANCVIFLKDQPTTFELPSGEVVEAPQGETGQVACGDAEAHLPTNTGDEGHGDFTFILRIGSSG